MNCENDGRDAEFETRTHAADRRAKDLLGLEAIAEGEYWPRCYLGGRARMEKMTMGICSRRSKLTVLA